MKSLVQSSHSKQPQKVIKFYANAYHDLNILIEEHFQFSSNLMRDSLSQVRFSFNCFHENIVLQVGLIDGDCENLILRISQN